MDCFVLNRAALKGKARAAAEKAIDDAAYGLLQVIDGVTGALSNANQTVYIDFRVRLNSRGNSQNDDGLSEIDLRNGDGMCMGYHGWLKGDFGEHPVAAPRQIDEP